MDILGKRIFFGDSVFAHDARHELSLAHAFLLDEQFERAKAAPAGRDFEHAGLAAVRISHRPHAETLKQCAAGYVFSELLD